MTVFTYSIFSMVLVSVVVLLYKLFKAENFMSVLILCSSLSSIATIALAMYSIITKNPIALDAISLFYITSHMVPVIYSIVLLYRDAKNKPV